MTIISAIGIIIYLGLAGWCVFAARVAAGFAEWRRARRLLLLAAIAFAGLALWRFFGTEEWLRTLARAWLAESGRYQTRKALQVAALLVLAIPAVLVLVRIARGLRRNGSVDRAAWLIEAGLWGMAMLMALRLTSWGPIDRILYGGPVHLNWLVEGAIVALVGLGAARTVMACRRQRGSQA